MKNQYPLAEFTATKSIRMQWKPAIFPIASATASRQGWRSFAVELRNTVVKFAMGSPGAQRGNGDSTTRNPMMPVRLYGLYPLR